MRNFLDKFYQAIEYIVMMVVLAAIAVCFGVCIIQIFCRFLLNQSIPWSDEVCRLTFFLSMFYGSVLCVLKRKHITVDVFYCRYPAVIRPVADLLIGCINIFFCVFMVKSGYIYSAMNATQLTTALALPVRYIYLMIPVSGVLMILCQLRVLYQDVWCVLQKRIGGGHS